VKKILISLFIIFMTFMVLSPLYVQASEGKVGDESSSEVESLYKYISNMKTQDELLNDMDPREYVSSFLKTGDGKFSTEKVTRGAITYALREVAASLKLMTIIIIIAIVCALLNNLQSAFSNETISNIAFFACYSLLIIILAKSFYVGVDLAKVTISKMMDFMAALMPVLMVLLASLGGFAEATVLDPIIIGTITISAKIFVGIIIPIICMGFVLQFVNSISEEFKINKLTKLLNQIALWIQGIIMTLFIGIITIRGISSKTIDQVTVKTAKYVVDNAVPIVGKSLSDAVSTVAGYSLLLKNALSSVGLVIIIIIIMFPVLKLLIMALIYKLTAALIEPISDSRLVDCINAAGDSLILIMSCVISISVMFFIMIAIVASAGKMAVGG
jgi:stage III sporulation protein AE